MDHQGPTLRVRRPLCVALPSSRSAGFFFLLQQFSERSASALVGFDSSYETKTETRSICYRGFFPSDNRVSAEEAIQPVKTDNPPEDSAKQVWPNFTPSCLRNADRAVNVRLVTVNRR